MDIQNVKFKMACTWGSVTRNMIAISDSAKELSGRVGKVATEAFQSLAQFFQGAYTSICNALVNLKGRIQSAFANKSETMEKIEEIKGTTNTAVAVSVATTQTETTMKSPIGSSALQKVVKEFLADAKDESKVRQLVEFLASGEGKQAMEAIKATLSNQTNLPLAFDWAESSQTDIEGTIQEILHLDDAALTDGVNTFSDLLTYVSGYNKALN